MENSNNQCAPTAKQVLDARREIKHGKCNPGQCAICKGGLPEEYHDLGMFKFPIHLCDRAAKLIDEAETLEAAEAIEQRQAIAAEKWHNDCPPLYKKLKPAQRQEFPKIDWDSYAKAMKWNPKGDKGLVMAGESGAGKSTTLWHLMLRLTRESHKWEVYSGGRLSKAYFSDMNGGSIERLTDKLASIEILALDDFGKGIITDGLGAMLFDVINRRTEQGMPIVMTTRFTSRELPARFKDDQTKGQDIARRLNDYCEVQTFRLNVKA
jgi:DNA replication protein DnaC